MDFVSTEGASGVMLFGCCLDDCKGPGTSVRFGTVTSVIPRAWK